MKAIDLRRAADLAELLVRRSRDTLMWLRAKGFRFVPIYGRQAFKIDGRFKFWGGLTVETVGGGEILARSVGRGEVALERMARGRVAGTGGAASRQAAA